MSALNRSPFNAYKHICLYHKKIIIYFIFLFLKVRYRDLPKKPNKKQFKEISSFNLSH